MKAKNKIVRKASTSLSCQTGLVVRPSDLNLSAEKEFDYRVEIIVPQDGELRTFSFAAEVKPQLNEAVIGNAAIRAKNFNRQFVLVTEYASPARVEKLRELGIQFFDTVGNAYLNSPGLFVFVTGNKAPEREKDKPLGLFRPAGIRLILALLTQPGMENADYRTIAADTGVPRTTVGELMKELEKSGYLRRRTGNRRFLINKLELIRRWVEEYGEKFRVKLDPVRFHSTKHTGRWWENADIAEYKAVWGGEAGGAILTRHLKPQAAVVYADSRLTRFQALNGLVRDDQGEIEILKKFWTFGEVAQCAPPLVVYADLVATADERNLETAQLIYDEYLAPLAEENS